MRICGIAIQSYNLLKISARGTKRGSYETQRGDSTGQHDSDSQGGTYFTENQAGCALGMASIARGCSFRRSTRVIPPEERRALGMEHVWGDWVLQTVTGPCNCWRFRVPREMRVKDTIAHIFDYHIMKKKDWTLDRLAECGNCYLTDYFAQVSLRHDADRLLGFG